MVGNHFSDISTDPGNEINIIYVGDTYCQVEERQDTEMKCRLASRTATSGYGMVSILMKLSESATIMLGEDWF